MSELFVESDAPEPGPFSFSVDSSDLLALLSFGYVEPFGSQHPLTEFVRRLKQSGVDVAPLTTFYERERPAPAAGPAAAEPHAAPSDAANLDAAWQDAAPLALAAEAARAALDGDPQSAQLRGDFAQLATLLHELQQMAAWAAQREARIRLSFRLG